jgi:hypothetical protein
VVIRSQTTGDQFINSLCLAILCSGWQQVVAREYEPAALFVPIAVKALGI